MIQYSDSTEKTTFPLVSVVMPAHNSAMYIKQAIQSVQKQTFKNWELLVVDGLSQDHTRQIVHEYREQDARIHLIENNCAEDCSAAGNRCRGIECARGKWIAFLDSDDVWLPEKLQIQLTAAQQYAEKFLFTASSFIDKNGKDKRFILHVPQQIAYPEILKQDIISCSSVLIEKDLLEGCFLEKDTQVSEDFSAWIRILRRTDIHAMGIDLPLLKYRLTRKSLSSNKFQSALRTFRTYRYMGLSQLESIYYWVFYVFRSIKKYVGVYRS